MMMYVSCNLLAILLIFTLGSFAQSPGTNLQFKDVTELQQFLTYTKNRVPLVSAHRGGPAKGFPENAIETFAHSMVTQPVIIECDIAMSQDSVLVLMHDNTLNRTTTGTGPVASFTYDYLKNLHLEDVNGDSTSFRIPTLDEALIWGNGKVIYTLDVKRGVPYAKVIEAVRRSKAESFSVIITYNANQAAEVHALAPDLMISASIQKQEDLQRLNSMGVPNNRLVAFVGTSEPDAALYTFLHQQGIQCILGVMGNLDKQATARGNQLYYDLITRGADVLSTDRAVEAGSMLQQYRVNHQLTSNHWISTTTTDHETEQKIVTGRLNDPVQQEKPYVILISADGFRHDFAEKYNAPFLRAMSKKGVKAKSMIPSFPTVTFPNHYTIATGRYPSHHGLVNNTFYDLAKNAT